MTRLSHSGGHVTRFLERVPQFLHVMRAGNRNDRRPSESPDNRERGTSGGGDKHVLASFLDLQNSVRRIERTIIYDNRSSRSVNYTSRTASNMSINRKSTRLKHSH